MTLVKIRRAISQYSEDELELLERELHTFEQFELVFGQVVLLMGEPPDRWRHAVAWRRRELRDEGERAATAGRGGTPTP